ncbi:MAG: hypothetical protein Q4C82_01365 [Eubacteriales bacterium]|nr:hypothetical protein [Eubacteriales bacterium]
MKKRLLRLLGAAVLTGALLGGCSQAAEQTETQTQETGAQADADAETDTDAETETGGDAGVADAASEDPADAGETAAAPLEDGVYTAVFDTDSGMFHVNEANDGRGTLTVENGEMTIHVSLASKNIVNLYAGLAEDAQKEGAQLLEPTVDSVTYSDGITEEVYGFDIPVPALDQEFDVALVGTKGTWYDHKVSVSDPESLE